MTHCHKFGEIFVEITRHTFYGFNWLNMTLSGRNYQSEQRVCQMINQPPAQVAVVQNSP